MALPVAITTTIVTGTFLDDNGFPIAGRIELTPSVDSLVSSTTKRVIRLTRHVEQLDANGSFSIPMIATDETDVTPSGWYWSARVIDPLEAGSIAFDFYVPGNFATIDLADYVINSTGIDGAIRFAAGARGPQGLQGLQGLQGTAGAPLYTVAAGATRPVASPNSLIVRAASYKNLMLNPSGRAGDSTVVTHRVNWHNQSAYGYFGSTVTTDATNLYNGKSSYKTVTDSATNPQGIIAGTASGRPSASGNRYWGRVAIKASKSVRMAFGGRVQGNVNFEGGNDTIITTAWREFIFFWDVPAGATTITEVAVQAALWTPESGVTVWMSRPLIEQRTHRPGQYFDGSTTGSGTITYSWDGTADASSSRGVNSYHTFRMNSALNAGLRDNRTGVNDRWFGTGGAGTSARIASGGRTLATNSLRKTWTTATSAASADVGFDSVADVTEGYVYTIGAWMRTNRTDVSLFATFEFYNVYGVSMGNYGPGSAVVSGTTGTWRYVTASVTAPTGARSARWTWSTTSSNSWAVNDYIEITEMQAEQSATLGDWFDAGTAPSDPYLYEYEGAQYTSPALQRAQRPALLVAEADSAVWRASSNGMLAFAQRSTGTNAPSVTQTISGLTPGATYTFSYEGRTASGTAVSRFYTDQLFSGPTLNATSWTRHSQAFVAQASTITIYMSLDTPGVSVFRRGLTLVAGAYDGPVFDGSIGPALWDGLAELSTSTLSAGALTFWDGTTEQFMNAEAFNAGARTPALIAAEAAARIAADGAEAGIRSAADALLIPLAQKGAPSGVATLDTNSLVPLAQLTNAVTSAVTTARQEPYARFVSAAITLAATDVGGVAVLSNTSLASLVQATIPTNASVPIAVGSWVDVCSSSIGTVLIAAASGVTLRGDGRVYGNYGVVRVLKIAADDWLVVHRFNPANAFARCFAYMDTNVTGWAAGWNHLPLNAELIDTHNGHNTGVITGSDTDTTSQTNRYTVRPGQAGTYKVGGMASITVGTTSTLHVRVLKNNTFFRGCTGITTSSANSGTVVTGEKLIVLAENDWVGIQGYCNNANWNSETGENANGGGTSWMSVERVD